MTAAIRNSHKKFAGPFYAGNRSASDASDISPHKISKKRKKLGLEREFLTVLTVLMGVFKTRYLAVDIFTRAASGAALVVALAAVLPTAGQRLRAFDWPVGGSSNGEGGGQIFDTSRGRTARSQFFRNA